MSVEKKQKKLSLRVGDTLEISNCRSIGLFNDRIQGVLICRPMNSTSVQLYIVWIPKGISSNDKEAQKKLIRELKEHDSSWEFAQITRNYDHDHILCFPVSFKNNIKSITHEGDDLIVGDIVLDRRWYMRYVRQPIRVVLSIKYDKGFDMNRVCLENPYADGYLNFGEWIYPVLRRDLIRVSRRKLKEFENEDTVAPINRLAAMLAQKERAV